MNTTPTTFATDYARVRTADPLILGPGQYPELVLTKAGTVRGTPGAIVARIKVENYSDTDFGGPVVVEDILFDHQNLTLPQEAVEVSGNIRGFVMNRCRAMPGKYQRAYSIDNADGTWPSPRNVRITDWRSAGHTNMGRWLGDACDVVETDVVLIPGHQLDQAGSYLNVFYTKGEIARNVKQVRCLSIGGATGFRGGNLYDSCYAEGAIVGLAPQFGVHTMRSCVGANCSRYELDLNNAGPVELEDCAFFSDLPAAQMETGYRTPVPVPGEAHCNIRWGGTSWMARMLGGYCYTRDPAPYQLMKVEHPPPPQASDGAGGYGVYGLHLVDVDCFTGGTAQVLMDYEGGTTPAMVTKTRGSVSPAAACRMADPTRTFTRWCSEVLHCSAEAFVMRPEKIADFLDWVRAGRVMV